MERNDTTGTLVHEVPSASSAITHSATCSVEHREDSCPTVQSTFDNWQFFLTYFTFYALKKLCFNKLSLRTADSLLYTVDIKRRLTVLQY